MSPRHDAQSPVRVAIVGGGCAALAAAFELTRPEHDGRYQVTVYQLGWRLGGKGASGRGAAGRIEEHGLHLWMGFYDNAFRLMRECYAERRTAFPGCRFDDWREAFTPAPDVAVADRTADGWEFWRARFPPAPGDPGDPAPAAPATVVAYLRQSTMLLGELLRSASAMTAGAPPAAGERPAASSAAALDDAAATLLRYGRLAGAAAVIEACDVLRQAIDRFFPELFNAGAAMPLRLIDALAAVARQQLDGLVAADGELRRVWHVIDLLLATLRGAARTGLAFDPRGFDALNDYDWRDWLRLHGASEASLESGFMRAIYDLVFAFEDGDIARPRLAAGVALRGAVRMFFTYRGAFFWRMNAGMGDVVFAPLYQVLRRRGVRFEFFHRLRNVGLSPGAAGEPAHVRTLAFDVQAEVAGGGEYLPLVDAHGIPSWPSRPDYRQLVNGAALARARRDFEADGDTRSAARKTLRVVRDFDLVVLGVSIGALPAVAPELLAREPRWQAMVDHVRTVPTQAFQVWLTKEVHALGWAHAPVNLSGFVEPFDTWADMSHLLSEERWRTPVRTLAYFCNVLPDEPAGRQATPAYLRRRRAEVRRNAVRFLNEDVGALWPDAVDGVGRFRWDLLAAGTHAAPAPAPTGERRFDTQYWTANVNASDRYVLSLPGSLKYRISPLDMTFDNLTIAGDWTATGLDSGCIESAVMSGLLAAHALSQSPPLASIVGYDHP